MNKYSLKECLQKKLAEFKSTLKSTSYDSDSQKHLCQDESIPQVYDFDAYVKKTYPHPMPASPDAIVIFEKGLYFVEFKNQNPRNIDKDQMQRKFKAGIDILKENLLKDFSARDCKYYFCVVFKSSNSSYMNYDHIEGNAVRFGLDELNQKLGNFYDKIVTQSLDFYSGRYSEHFETAMHCRENSDFA